MEAEKRPRVETSLPCMHVLTTAPSHLPQVEAALQAAESGVGAVVIASGFAQVRSPLMSIDLP